MKYINKKIIVLIIVLISSTVVSFSADSRKSNNYNYDTWGNEIVSAPTWNEVYTINQDSTGVNFGELVDATTDGEYIYIVDQSNSIIYIVDSKYQVIDSIEDFNDGDTFNKPSSIDVNDDFIVVADTGNKRIVEFDKQLNFVREITKIDAPGLENGFIPQKVEISDADDIYIIAQGIYEGIISITNDGTFIKYTGTNKVNITVVDKFWRSFASKEQLNQMQDFLPTEFTSLSVDNEGFIYTTTTSDKQEPIKRLNTNGENVLVYPEGHAPQGDIIVDATRGVTQLNSIDINDSGNYAVIDGTTGRFFVYDQEGYLLSIYGNLGTQGDHFRTPTSINWYSDNKILITDKVNKEIIVLQATDFLNTVLAATNAYYENDMETSYELWEKALNYNSNYELAYLGIGRVYQRNGDYQQAAENFKLANNKTYYSKAFKEIRAEFFKDNFMIISIVFIALLVLIYRGLGDGEDA